MNEDNFSDHPLSIGEIKATKAANGSKWTPRDCLISALRDIDSGKIDPNAVVIICGKYDPIDDSVTSTYYQSSKNSWEMLGLIEEAKLTLLK